MPNGGTKFGGFLPVRPFASGQSALGPVIYVLPEEGGMYAVKPETGESVWYAADPAQFISASPQRVYALDKFNRLAILDAKPGAG